MANFISSPVYEKGSGGRRRSLTHLLIVLTAAMPAMCVDVVCAQNAEKKLATFSQLIAGARQGDPETQKALGDAYAKGDGVAQSDATAVEWYRKAASRGLASAQSALGAMIMNGRGGQRDLKQAEHWLRAAANQGYAAAEFNLGGLYLDARDADGDPIAGEDWIRRAAEQGLPVAEYTLGHFAFISDLADSKKRAYQWFAKAADQGYASAQFVVGQMIWRSEDPGPGAFTSEQAEERADRGAAWYRKAAENSLAIAQYEYAGALETKGIGDGTTWRLPEALKWYRSAALQDWPEAQARLGNIYLGDFEALPGAERDYGQAIEWLAKAAKAGDLSARQQLCAMYDLARGVSVPFTAGNVKPQSSDETRLALTIGLLLTEPRKSYLDGDRLDWDLGENYRDQLSVPFDENQTVEWYRRTAERGDARAQYRLGVMFMNGLGVSLDPRSALSWLRKAASAGDAFAQELLGEFYLDSGPHQDAKKAVGWLEKAARQDNPHAQFELGFSLQDHGDFSKSAFLWFLKAAKNGDPGAALWVAEYYFPEPSPEPSPKFPPYSVENGMKWLRIAAGKGDIEAMERLADLYQQGEEGVAKDVKAAIAWQEMAVKYGSAKDAIALGNRYEFGHEAPRDYRKALDYFQRAVELRVNSDSLEVRSARPETEIAALYDAMHDDVNAFVWAEKAAQADNASSADMERLADFFAKGRGVAQDYAKAFHWTEKAALAGDGSMEDKVRLADLYVEGRGVAQDFAKAAELYSETAANGNLQAQFQLGLLYAGGEGVAKDVAMAHFLLSLALRGNAMAVYDNPVRKALDAITATMTADEIAEAEALAKEWRPGAPLPVRPK